jgi:hypothetical protein
MTEKELLIEKAKKVIKEKFKWYPFRKPLDKWSIEKLESFITAFKKS